MPRLWEDTIATHRQAVREAILQATWTLVERHGLLAITMSQVAHEVGIGRATLYKYFPDVESILLAGHDDHVAAHIERLKLLRDGEGTAAERLILVLREFAEICFLRGRLGSTELVALLHGGEHVRDALDDVREMISGLLADAAEEGAVRNDIGTSELAHFAVHALSAANGASDQPAVERLAAVTMDGLLGRRGLAQLDCVTPD